MIGILKEALGGVIAKAATRGVKTIGKYRRVDRELADTPYYRAIKAEKEADAMRTPVAAAKVAAASLPLAAGLGYGASKIKDKK